jgi:hypothetical protein
MTQFFTGEINLQSQSSLHHRDIRNLPLLDCQSHQPNLKIQQLSSMQELPNEMDRLSQAVAA